MSVLPNPVTCTRVFCPQRNIDAAIQGKTTHRSSPERSGAAFLLSSPRPERGHSSRIEQRRQHYPLLVVDEPPHLHRPQRLPPRSPVARRGMSPDARSPMIVEPRPGSHGYPARQEEGFEVPVGGPADVRRGFRAVPLGPAGVGPATEELQAAWARSSGRQVSSPLTAVVDGTGFRPRKWKHGRAGRHGWAGTAA